MKCANCQFDVSADFAFCPGCGSKLAPAVAAPPIVAHADRRAASVLFADLSGFTTISERLDPEDVRALQTDLFEALSGVITRYDAFVEKFVAEHKLLVQKGARFSHLTDAEKEDILRLARELRDAGGTLTEVSKRIATRLGRHKMGKSCLSIRKLADVDRQVLERLIRDSVTEIKQRYG